MQGSRRGTCSQEACERVCSRQWGYGIPRARTNTTGLFPFYTFLKTDTNGVDGIEQELLCHFKARGGPPAAARDTPHGKAT